MPRTAGRTDRAPAPVGPYSQSVRIGSMVAAAGQAGITPDGTVVDGVYEQTHQALSNVVAALAASGATADDIISVRVFLTEPSQFAAMNDAYVRFFEEPFPARTTVYVGLPPGLHVEIDAIALVQDSAE